VFRINALAVLCLGLLVSCGPAGQQGPASEDSRGQKSSALTTFAQKIQVSVSALDFGHQRVGTTSGARVVVVSNTGDASLTVSAVSIVANQPFDVSPGSAFMLAPGENRALSVTFKPAAEGVATGTLTLTTNDPATPEVSISLSGTGVRPNLQLSADALFFGNQRVGTTSLTLTVLVTNTGTGPLVVQSVAASGPFESSTVPVPFVLPPNERQVLSVTFKPTTEGQATGTLTLLTDDPASSKVIISLAGTGVAPHLQLDPVVLDFQEQSVGTSTTKMVVVRNTGSAPLNIQSLSTSGQPFAVVTGNMPLTLEPAEQEMFLVTFSPAQAGAASGKLYLVTDDPASPDATVPLSGTGVKPSVVLNTSSLAFGEQRVGTPSPAQALVVSNLGARDLHIVALSFSGPFSLAAPASVPFTLPPATSQQLAVEFKPAVVGAATGTLTLLTNDPDRPIVEVQLSGRGVTPQLVLSPSELAFGEQRVGTTSAAKKVMVGNTGSGPLHLMALSFGAGEPFAVTPSSALTLAPGESQELSVTFKPTATGAASGTLTLSTDDPARPQVSVALSGTGVKPTLAVSTSSLAFGEQRVGTASTARTVTVTNPGSLGITVLTTTSQPFAVTPGAAFTLAPGASQELSVTFSPTSAGAATGTLTLTPNDEPSSSVTVALSGGGVKTAATLSATSLVFEAQAVGTTSTAKVVTVSNSGSATLHVSALSIGAGQPFAVTPGVPFQLPAGTSQDLLVTFSPTAQGQATGTLTLTTDDPDRPEALVALSGSGVVVEEPSEPDAGGCSCASTQGGSVGMMALLMLVGLAARRRRA
jgi:MYXO-CTERM domain-containing protein